MKKTARVIITSKCDRKCPGCCNSKLDYTSLAKVIGGITALKDYHPVILKHLDGITVTVHAEATDEDIRNLKYMSSNLYDEDLDMRLFIDKRVYDRYDLSNICMKTWDVVRKLEWKEKCDPAENEELFLWNLY